MNKDLASEFCELKRPKTGLGATLRFFALILVAAALDFIAPFSWGEWQSGLIIGVVAGLLWAISWRWKGAENRLIVWLVIYLGGMALWGTLHGDVPSLGALACAYVGFEFVLLILHSRLRAWTDPAKRRNEEAKQGFEPQSATRSESDSGDGDEPQPEAAGRSR
jgi:hypothetical protein